MTELHGGPCDGLEWNDALDPIIGIDLSTEGESTVTIGYYELRDDRYVYLETAVDQDDLTQRLGRRAAAGAELAHDISALLASLPLESEAQTIIKYALLRHARAVRDEG